MRGGTVLPALPGALGADTPHAPSALGAGAQPTYMSAGRGPDAGLAAGSGAAAAGAVPGRRRPSSGRRGTRAGHTAASAAPPARSARRVHPARASPRAGSARCPTGVSARAALRRSAPGLVPASPPRSAPGGPPGLASLSPPRGLGEISAPGNRMPGRRGASEGKEAPGARRAGGWHRGPAWEPARQAPASSRPARSPLPPLRPPLSREALLRRPALRGVGDLLAARLPAQIARPTCQSPARPPARLLPCRSLSMAPFIRASFFPLFFSLISSFLIGPLWLSSPWTAWFCRC